MTNIQTVYIAVSAACSFVVGWSMGRSIPQWQIDKGNEPSAFNKGCIYTTVYAWGLILVFMMTLKKPFGYLSMFLIALTLALLGLWSDLPPMKDTSAFLHEATQIFYRASFFSIAMFLLGYIPSRITDKGPMGPVK